MRDSRTPSLAPRGTGEQSISQAVSHFAYPFGGRGDFDDRSVDAARSAGFATASTTLPGTARSSTDPYRRPRRASWTGDGFDSGLSCNDGNLAEQRGPRELAGSG